MVHLEKPAVAPFRISDLIDAYWANRQVLPVFAKSAEGSDSQAALLPSDYRQLAIRWSWL